jgi:ribonuclease BN (tRNA processing enzyme)
MKVVFLGVGEACDENYPNNSHLILSDTALLLDCGYSVPGQLWKYNPEPSFPDAIFISHDHADHYFGIPALLVRMWEEKRTNPLTFICPKGLKRLIEGLIERGYKNLYNGLPFAVKYLEVMEGQKVSFNELSLSFASTLHSARNLAIRVDNGFNSVCYSGDGMFDEKTEKLYSNADLVIHESYFYDRATSGHACITGLIDMAKRNNIKCLALTHLHRNMRKSESERISLAITGENVKVILPEPFEEYTL